MTWTEVVVALMLIGNVAAATLWVRARLREGWRPKPLPWVSRVRYEREYEMHRSVEESLREECQLAKNRLYEWKGRAEAAEAEVLALKQAAPRSARKRAK